MKTQLAKCEPAQSDFHHRPAIREVKFQKPEATITFSGRAWKRICGMVEWILSLGGADEGIETWRRLEFRNEYQERRDPKMLDIHRWY